MSQLHTVQGYSVGILVSQRAFYSIDEDVLEGFNRLVPAAKRSKLVQNMIAKYVAQNDSLIERAARQIEADPSYNEVLADTAAFSNDVLNRMRDE
jgi:hypothetical protein